MIQFVDQNVQSLGIAPSSEDAMLKLIEKAGRVAYRSEDKITEDSAAKFVQHLKGLGHLSVLEHSNIVMSAWLPEYNKPTFEPAAYATFADRTAFHRFRQIGQRGYFSGNIRAWLESVAFLAEKYVGDHSPLLESLHFYLHEYFPSLFPSVIGLTKDDIQEPLTLVPATEQLEILRADPGTDLPIFVFKIVCDRGISHEIVRHRVFSFTQESTRYVNYGGKGLTLIKPEEYDACNAHCYKEIPVFYEGMLYSGLKPQIARDVLPNLLKTEIVVSGRWSGWKHFIELRDNKAAHPRIQKIGRSIREWFENVGLAL